VGKVENNRKSKQSQGQALTREGERDGNDGKNYRHEGADGAAHYLTLLHFRVFNGRRVEDIIPHHIETQAEHYHIYRENYYGQFQIVFSTQESCGKRYQAHKEEKDCVDVG